MGDEQLRINWTDMGDGWRRSQWVRPGYDCMNVPCKHTPKGDHGVSDDDWIYVVSDGVLTLALSVRSGVYPPTVKRIVSGTDKPHAYDFEIHAPWPVGGDDDVVEIIRLGRTGTKCDLVETGTCWVQRTGMSCGGDWYKEHGGDKYEQSGFFWDALRTKARELFASVYQEHEETKHIVRCPCCEGKGVVDDRKGG